MELMEVAIEVGKWGFGEIGVIEVLRRKGFRVRERERFWARKFFRRERETEIAGTWAEESPALKNPNRACLGMCESLKFSTTELTT